MKHGILLNARFEIARAFAIDLEILFGSEMPEHTLNLLHVSDLHQRTTEASAWRRMRVLGEAWERNLDALLEDGPVDVVCFTGDVAFSGQADEYQRATEFFQAMLERLNLGWERFFSVPGNHDIDRRVSKPAWKRLRLQLPRARQAEVAEWLAGGRAPLGFKDRDRKEVLERQGAYRRWVNQDLGRRSLDPEGSPHGFLGYRETLTLAGLPFAFHLVGLDSAWMCGDEGDAGHLWLTDEQVMRLASNEGKTLDGFRLALIHHPLEDLADGSRARRLLAERVDLVLRGHLHEPEAQIWADPERTLRQVAAGCLYEHDHYPNACERVRITLDEKGRPLRLEVRFRGWSERGHWFNDNSLYPGTVDGRLSILTKEPESRGDNSLATLRSTGEWPEVAVRGHTLATERHPPVTRSTHVLPFLSLSPADFERICLALVLREGFERPEHLGAAGRDSGCDIVAYRGGRRVVFQCKRYGKLGPRDAEAVVSEMLSLPEHDKPQELILVVTCAVSAEARKRALKKAAAIDFQVWGLTELDARVQRYPDLVSQFFNLGVDGKMGPAGEQLSRLTLESHRQIRTELEQGFQNVNQKLERLQSDPLVQEVHTQRVVEELNRIIQRRAWDPIQARESVRELLARVESGDLRHATPKILSVVLHWAARLHAGEPEDLTKAKSYRDRIQAVDPKADTRILDAVFLEAIGDVDEALWTLRDIHEPDARATFFAILHKVRGRPAALGWFDDQEGRQEPDFLTGIGWNRVAVALAESNRWEEAAAYAAATRKNSEKWPDLLFVEGVLNAAQLLPSERRQHALELNLFHPELHTIEGPEADRHRERATLCFREAEEQMAEPFPERALGARRWLLWLRLTNPDPAVSQSATEEVREGMQNPEQALSLLSVARAFGIPFEAEKLRIYLDQRALLGGLKEYELQARFMLAEMSLAPTDLLAFLDEEASRLRRVFPEGLLYGVRIEALVKDGQAAKAREVLRDHGEDFEEDDRQRLEAMIEANEGKDPRPRLEKLYGGSHKLTDLENLVQQLRKVRDWSSLRPLLQELFQRERTLSNALRLVHCMQSTPEEGEADILAFLEGNRDLVDRNTELKSATAWALFRAGRLAEARLLNEGLLCERERLSGLQLDINIALQSGEWERFSVIVEREWPRREDLKPETLIQLASLVAEADGAAGRALELVRLAADKGSTDPHVLTAAVNLAFRLGSEGDQPSEWLARAMSLSSDEGPVRAIDIRTLVEEWMPADRERRREIEEKWLHGQLPIHLVATELRVPLTYLLVGLPRSNATVQDGRLRTIVPIVSGVRQPVSIKPEWTVGLDVTSLIVLAHLGLLEETMESFGRLVLPPDTMLLLLQERNRVRFHQPSLVKRAQDIISKLGAGQLRVAEPLPQTPQGLSDEVGIDLAQLLQAAKENLGCVVHPRPVQRLRSFANEEAQLGEYDALVLSTVDLEELLYRRGDLDTTTHQNASRYLLSQDRGSNVIAQASQLEKPLYLDVLAISFLQSAGLLPAVVNCGLDLRVHPTLRHEQSDLIARYREGEQLAEAINEIRLKVRNALHVGRAEFLPRRDPANEEGKKLAEGSAVLGQLLWDDGPYDCLATDDRFLNKNGAFLDRKGKAVPIICILDILFYLEKQGVMTPEGHQNSRHKLRQAGFAFVPVESEELKRYLAEAKWRADGTFIESAELRTIRQTLARIRSLDVLRQPGEDSFLSSLRQTSSLMISQLWLDESLLVERAVYLTEWIWRYLCPPPVDWRESMSQETFILNLSLLLQPLLAIRQERRDAFLDWMEDRVLKPLASANSDILDNLTLLAWRYIEEWSELRRKKTSRALAIRRLLSLQPASILERLQRSASTEIAAFNRFVIGIDERASVSRDRLFAAARRVLWGRKEERLLSLEGDEIILSKRQGSIFALISHQNRETRRVIFDELKLFSKDRDERLKELDHCLEKIGPLGPDFKRLRQAARSRLLSGVEVGELLDALWNGVAGQQERLRAQLACKKATIWHLIPNSLDYFDRFCGPDPGGIAPEEYLGVVLPEYRKALLRRDLEQGLKICLMGALRDDLCPGAWVETVDDEKLWLALEACEPQLEPMSLLGALDIALYRQHHERFRAFADAAVDKLTKTQFLDSEGFDLYQFLPSMAQFIVNRINLLEGGVSRRPFWRRMGTWMQTNLVIRHLLPLSVDWDGLRNQFDKNLSAAGRYVSLLDLRREPIYAASELSAFAFRREIIHRLLCMKARHGAAGRNLPKVDHIGESVKQLVAESGLPLCWAFPGPLEGHLRPEEAGSLAPVELKDKLLEFSLDHLLSNTARLSQLFHFDDETRSTFRELVSKSQSENTGLSPQELLSRFANAGLLAAVERDRELAQTIAKAILALAPVLHELGAMALGLQALLIAAAAFKEETAWAEWLKEQLSLFAGRLPAGRVSAGFYDHIQELKEVTRLELDVYSRAEALASAAARDEPL